MWIVCTWLYAPTTEELLNKAHHTVLLYISFNGMDYGDQLVQTYPFWLTKIITYAVWVGRSRLYICTFTSVSNRHGVVIVWVRVLCWSDKLLASANRPTINSHNGSCLVLDWLLGMIITKASRKCRRAHLSANENNTNGRFTISMEYSIHMLSIKSNWRLLNLHASYHRPKQFLIQIHLFKF